MSPYARSECLTILAIGLLLSVCALVVGWWWAAPVLLGATVLVLAFFRDPDRRPPTQRGVLVAPADGRVSSVHELEHFEPFDGPAVCVRIFLSVFDVHINRSPCHGQVLTTVHKPGKHANALNPDSAEDNESVLMVLGHPVRGEPIAAVRQVSGMLARTIVCKVHEGQVLQRGERFGMIKLGSTTELYLPRSLEPELMVERGQRVAAGLTVLARLHPRDPATAGAGSSNQQTPPRPEGEADQQETSTSSADTPLFEQQS